MTNAYDVVRYPSRPFWHTHPAALGVFAALFGKRFTPLERARVLEIGCGEGINLLNIALWSPGAECVGVDLAQAPIAAAQAAAAEIGLGNARFDVRNILDMDESLGAFDYVIAHGVYAWVPDAVREALMRVVGRLLSPDGLAFISYNAFPGSRLRMALRDLLLDATAQAQSPGEKLDIARAALASKLEIWSPDDPLQNAMIGAAREILGRAPESLFHDELGAFYAPQYLTAVVDAAREAGLEYLCDARPHLIGEAFFPSERYASAREGAKGDWVRFEQLTDFDDMRSFRNSIFCRGAVERRFEPKHLRGLWVSGQLEPAKDDARQPDESVFHVGGGTITTNNPALAKLLGDIAAAFPSYIRLDEAAEDGELASAILRLFSKKCVMLSTAPAPVTIAPGEYPFASPLARLQARRGESLLTTLKQSAAQIEDETFLEFVALVDGRSRGDLAAELRARLGGEAEDTARQTGHMLSIMANLALLKA